VFQHDGAHFQAQVPEGLQPGETFQAEIPEGISVVEEPPPEVPQSLVQPAPVASKKEKKNKAKKCWCC